MKIVKRERARERERAHKKLDYMHNKSRSCLLVCLLAIYVQSSSDRSDDVTMSNKSWIRTTQNACIHYPHRTKKNSGGSTFRTLIPPSGQFIDWIRLEEFSIRLLPCYAVFVVFRSKLIQFSINDETVEKPDCLGNISIYIYSFVFFNRLHRNRKNHRNDSPHFDAFLWIVYFQIVIALHNAQAFRFEMKSTVCRPRMQKYQTPHSITLAGKSLPHIVSIYWSKLNGITSSYCSMFQS